MKGLLYDIMTRQKETNLRQELAADITFVHMTDVSVEATRKPDEANQKPTTSAMLMCAQHYVVGASMTTGRQWRPLPCRCQYDNWEAMETITL